MNDTLTLTGIVATDPQSRTTTSGVQMTSFRLASSQRRFDRAAGRWIDGDTNWYSVTAFRHLGSNAGRSLVKGDRVIVVGRLRIRQWEQAERSGSSVDLEADTIGHDLSWGTSVYSRVRTTAPEHGPGAGSGSGAAAEESFPETVPDTAAGALVPAPREAEPVPF
ncbi:single-stranded DNA-binding protein [Cnuibacter sp. UC19_7]|uniref:single-stranded DNA-binding protein n=1 Tax=Cnuibacter sp. UC19_7 TaxID=3350166 RepID=UPI00366FA1A1